MLSKGERKTKLKKVSMSIVKLLLRWRKEQNDILAGTGFSCNLHPKTSEPCTSCIYRKKCIHYEWERDYIHKHEKAEEDARMRKKISGKEEQKNKVANSHFCAEPIYPCEPFDFDCPNKDSCREGRNCPWKEE